MRQENGLQPGEIVIDRYVYTAVEAVNGINYMSPDIGSATLRYYYTDLDLDTTVPRDGTSLHPGDIDETTLSLYHWDNDSKNWQRLTTDLDYVTALILHEENGEKDGTPYAGYIECTIQSTNSTNNLGLFALAGSMVPDETPAGPPVVVSTIPDDNGINIPFETPIIVTFNEPVVAENLSAITLKGGEIDDVTITADGTRLQIHHPDLSPGVSYVVTIPEWTVADEAGNANQESHIFQFTTIPRNNIPLAQDDFFVTTQDQVINGSVLADNGNGPDQDTENDPLQVTEINGNGSLVGTSVAGSQGGAFTIQLNGTISFDPGNDFSSLDPGDSRVTEISYSLSDGFGTAHATVRATVYSNDNSFTDDEDGISAAIEDAAPNGGDGNGDGILDSEQSDVTSLPSATGRGYITIQVSEGCNIINEAQTMLEPVSDPNYTYPFGLVGFSLQCSSAKIRIYFHGSSDMSGYTYRKYGPTPPEFSTSHWYTLPDVNYGTEVINGKTVAYTEFTLTDGELGDDTDIDGWIVDQGGPGQPAAINSVPVPTMTEWGMMIFMLLVGLFAVIQIRRKIKDISQLSEL